MVRLPVAFGRRSMRWTTQERTSVRSGASRNRMKDA